MDKSTPQDAELQAKVDKWRGPFDSYAKEVVGVVTERLDATRCQKGECGCFLSCWLGLRRFAYADFGIRHSWELYLRCYTGLSTGTGSECGWCYHECRYVLPAFRRIRAPLRFCSGGIRASIPAGNVTRGE